MTVISIIQDHEVEDFLKGATLQEAAIFKLFQNANFDPLISDPGPVAYLPDALAFLDYVKEWGDTAEADIVLWLSLEYNIPVQTPKLVELAEKIFHQLGEKVFTAA